MTLLTENPNFSSCFYGSTDTNSYDDPARNLHPIARFVGLLPDSSPRSGASNPAKFRFANGTALETIDNARCSGALISGVGSSVVTIALADGDSCALTLSAATGTVGYTGATLSRIGTIYRVTAGTLSGGIFGGTFGADFAVPSLSISGVPATTNAPFFATFTFSEPVTGFDIGDIAVGNGAASDFTGSGTTYTALITPASAGDVTVDVAAGVAQDGAGNPSTAAATAISQYVPPPTVTITAPSGTVSGIFTAIFTFSEPVTGFTVGDIGVTNGAADAFSGSGTTYTAIITPSIDGTVTISVPAAVAENGDGVSNLAADPASVDFRDFAPSEARFLEPQFDTRLSAGRVTAFTGRVQHNSNRCHEGAPTVEVYCGDHLIGNATVSFCGTTPYTCGFALTTAIPAACIGESRLRTKSNSPPNCRVNAEALLDLQVPIVTPSPPTVSISGVPARSNGPFTVTIEFSQTVTGFEVGDIGGSNINASNIAGSGTTYTALITPVNDGTATVEIPADAAQGVTNLGNVASLEYSTDYDGTPPTLVSIVRQEPATSPTNADVLTWRLTFSEKMRNADESNFSVLGGAADLLVVQTTPTEITVSAFGTPLKDYNGDVQLEFVPVNQRTISDPAGNILGDATPSGTDQSVYTLQNGALTLKLAAPATAAGPFTATFTFSAAVNDFELGDIAVGNGSASDLAGSGTTYTARITPAGDGIVTIDVAAGAAQDAAGNPNAAAIQAQVTVDTGSPTVTISGVPPRTNGSFDISIAFSETVSGFDAGDIGLLNAVASNFSGTGSTYSATITPQAAGRVAINIAAGVASDAQGNPNIAAAEAETTFDDAGPELQIVGVPSEVRAPFVARFVFSEPVTGFELGDIVVSGGQATDFSGSGMEFQARILPDANARRLSIEVAAGVATDEVGNGNQAASRTGIAVDQKRPTVKLKAPRQARGPFTATIQFSEPVRGFSRGDIDVDNGRASKLRGGPRRYRATITPANQGSVTIRVEAGVAKDEAGNTNLRAKPVITAFIDEELIRSRTSSTIANFMAGRADGIAANEPGLVSRLQRGGGANVTASPFNVTGSGTLSQGQTAFATSLRQIVGSDVARRNARRAELGQMMSLGQTSLGGIDGTLVENGFDLWVQGKWAYASRETSASDLGLLYIGADYRFNDAFLVGLMTQFDWTDERDTRQATAADGTGWMAGPYLVARLSENLIFDGRAAWGQSDNSVSPFGSYVDHFDGERWLLRGQFTGDLDYQGWRFAPHVGILHFEEEQAAYVNSQGILIPGQTVSLSRLTFGPELSTVFVFGDGTSISPRLNFKGIWDFNAPATRDLETGLAAQSAEGLRGRVEGGIAVGTPLGFSVMGEGFYDGLGAEDFESYGGSVAVKVPF